MALEPIAIEEGAEGTPSPLQSPNLRSAQEQAARVVDYAHSNYILAHPPDEWQVREDGTLVPVLVQLSKSPGVQGVGTRGEFGAAETYYRNRGFTLIPHDILPHDYVTPYRTHRGRVTHRGIFQTPINGAGTTYWSFDQESYDAFIELLRLKGYIKAPKPNIIAALLESKRLAYNNLRPPSSDDPNRREAYEREVAMLKRQITNLEHELGESYKAHGQPKSRAGGDLLKLVKGEKSRIAEADGKADAAVTKVMKGRTPPNAG